MKRRSNTTAPLVIPTLDELARTERSNRKKKSNLANRGDNMDGEDQRNEAPPQVVPQAQEAEVIRLRAQVTQLEGMFRQLTQQVEHNNAQQNQPRGEEIGQAHRPHAAYRVTSPIILPPITRQDFELKPQLVSLAENSMFTGETHENPIEHIERIDRICGVQKINGVSQDYIKCKLFEFTLGGKAAAWFSQLPANSLDGWMAVRNAFLDHFFTKTKTAELRMKISGFKQMHGENFSEAWDRFKSYKRSCPHHGFTENQLLNIFYEGVQRGHKIAMDSASNGNFMTRTVLEGTRLIENLAESAGSNSQEYDRSKPVHSVESQKITERLESLEKLIKDSLLPSEPHEIAYAQEEDVNYVNGQPRQGFNNWRNHPNFSWRNPNVENPQDQVYDKPPPPLNSNSGFVAQQVNQGYQGQQAVRPFQPQQGRGFINQRPQAQFNAPYQPPPNPLEELKASMNQMLAYQQKAEARSEERFNSLETRFDNLQAHVKTLDNQVAQNAEAIRRQPGTLPGRTEGNPKHEHIRAITTSSDNSQVRIPTEKKQDPNVLISSVAAEEVPRKRRPIFRKAVLKPPVYTPNASDSAYYEPPPYPDVIEEKKPPQLKEEPKEECKVVSTLEVAQPTGDEGPFYLPIQIRNTNFPHIMCDTGASVNTIPLKTAREVGFNEDDFKPVGFSVSLADSTLRRPVGMLEDIDVIIGGVRVPTDFVVMDIESEDNEFMVLGRPFLSSTGATLDFRERRIDLDFGWKRIRFYPDDVVIIPHPIKLMAISTPNLGTKLLTEIREKCKELINWKKIRRSKTRPCIAHEGGDPKHLRHSPMG